MAMIFDANYFQHRLGQEINLWNFDTFLWNIQWAAVYILSEGKKQVNSTITNSLVVLERKSVNMEVVYFSHIINSMNMWLQIVSSLSVLITMVVLSISTLLLIHQKKSTLWRIALWRYTLYLMDRQPEQVPHGQVWKYNQSGNTLAHFSKLYSILNTKYLVSICSKSEGISMD